MDYLIIFYNASKTSACEKALTRILSPAGFSLAESNAAGSKQILGNFLSGGFLRTNLIITVSDFSVENDCIISVLSKSINPEKPVKCKKYEDFGAYFITCENQALLLFPDSPDEISKALEFHLLDRLQEFFKDVNN